MIVKGKNVIGLNIVTIDTGTVIQTVNDIAYDPTTQRIVALIVDNGGLFSSAKAVHMDDVQNIGEDAVIVQDSSVIKPVKEIGDTVKSLSDSSKYLVQTNVLTVLGKELGKVTDIYFDSSTGNVESMEVSQGGLKTMTEGKKSIKPVDIVTIGADATVVSTYTEAKLEQQGEEAGLKGAFNDAKDKANEIANDTKERANELAADAKERSIEFRDAAQERAEEARDAIQERAEDARQTIDEKSAEARIKAEELRADVAQRSRELGESIDDKADDLKEASRDRTDDIRIKAEELSRDAKLKSQQLQDVAEDKAAEARTKINELANETKERTQDVKVESRTKVDSAYIQGDKVVEQTKEQFKNGKKSIKSQKTKITRR